MKTYSIRFTGRRRGAIGKFHECEAERFALNPEQAIQALYDDWEHIQQPQVKEIEHPFSGEFLENIVHNDPHAHDTIRRAMLSAVRAVEHLAEKQAKANKEWHDDPESADHWLFHAPHEMQFPAPEVMRTAAEVLLYFMRETPAGREIYDSLTLKQTEVA